jgi:hypothetical protein
LVITEFITYCFACLIAGVLPVSISSGPPGPSFREGGETVAEAIVVTVPYSDSGDTSDNVNDYDEVCPYTGSTAPDVVYVYTPADDGYVHIDLCEATYDTKLYVYESGVTAGTPYACSDDYSLCEAVHRSRLSAMAVSSGISYYVVVDGYGDGAGAYTLAVTSAEPPSPPCMLECPIPSIVEGEPTLIEDYTDLHNGGCNSDPDQFQFIDQTEIPFCGVSGWYQYEGAPFRDTDWFAVIADENGFVELTCRAEYELICLILLPTDCQNLSVVYDGTTSCDEPGAEIEFAHPTGTECWIWIGPTSFTGPVDEFDYILTLAGIEAWDNPVAPVSWGGLKGMYLSR